MKILSNPNRLSLAVALVIGGVAATPGGVNAQEQKVGQIELEEVIVTAEKREQSLQEVPVAISAFTADMLEARGIDKPEDLQFFVPGLNLGVATTGTAQVTIRGAGVENLSSGGDPGVPMHLNGHYIQSSTYILRDFLDIERVEVQRGPQGTLYGRNAIGGNINVITNRPTNDFEGIFSVDVGSYSKRRAEGILSGPLGERMRGRLAVASEKRDGYVENTAGPDLLDSDYINARASLEIDVTDNLQAYVSGYYYNDDSLRRLDQRIMDPNYEEISHNGPFDASDEANGISLDLTWDLGSVEFRSLTAYNDTEDFTLVDRDRTAAASQTTRISNAFETYSQEFQLLSKGDADLKWVVGAFYYQEDSSAELLIKAPPSLVFQLGPTELDSTSSAVFGQMNWLFVDQWELIAGLRYTRDEKEISRSLIFAFAPPYIPVTDTSDESWTEFTGKLGVNYYASEDVMLYASYSQGYKAGGFNYDVVGGLPYDAEYINALEIGIKSQWFENRLQLNLAAFYNDYTDKQEQVRFELGGAVFSRFTNAAETEVTGLELEISARPTAALSLDATIGYQEAEYKDFESIDSFHPELALQDLSGNALARSPELKWSVGGQYNWGLGNMGGLTARVDYSWTDEVNVSPFNRPEDELSDYERINARLWWENSDETWLAELYIRNLEDDIDVTNVFPISGGDNVINWLPPREYGLRVRYSF